jgi:hypothetical protein
MEGPITSAVLIRRLPLLEGNILVEAARGPSYFREAARYRVACMRDRLRADMALDIYKAKLGLHIRARRTIQGKKVTEAHIGQILITSKRVQALQRSAHQAIAREEMSKLILESYRQRKESIQIIAQARFAEGAPESQEVDRIVRRQMVRRARELESMEE